VPGFIALPAAVIGPPAESARTGPVVICATAAPMQYADILAKRRNRMPGFLQMWNRVIAFFGASIGLRSQRMNLTPAG